MRAVELFQAFELDKTLSATTRYYCLSSVALIRRDLPAGARARKGKSERKPGGQPGSVGNILETVPNPDRIQVLKVDRRRLPKGQRYHPVGFETRQVIDLKVTRVVTEYRAEILEGEQGRRYVAGFPAEVSRPVQYGASVRAHAVYLSQFQLVPYERVCDQFRDQMRIPVSAGSLFNFNREAYERLADFEQWAKAQLASAAVAHADETGINIDGKRHWLHCLSTSGITLLYPHDKRGVDAMDAMGVLPLFRGVLCHDHWKPYYRYTDCVHSLCNAHHLRKLARAWEQDGQSWAQDMVELLRAMNDASHQNGGLLVAAKATEWRQRYRDLLHRAETECPPPDAKHAPGKKGRVKRSKARNLLERLRDYEEDVLRFLDDPLVPFTNNQGENALRMTKVQQKISGCFRTTEGARMFCRVRSHLSTCRKQGVSPTEGLAMLFRGENPEFMNQTVQGAE